MRKHRRGFIVIGIVFFILCGVGCGKKKESAPAALPAGEMKDAGDLQIVSSTPRGDAASSRESDAVMAIFDRPMIPLQGLPEGKGSSFLKINPSFAGKFRWLGTKTLVFTPDKRFPYGTPITVSIPAGTRSLDGYILRKEFTWTFNTLRPQLIRTNPRDKQEGLDLTTDILLVFNQPLPREKASKFLALTAFSRDGQTSNISFKTSAVSEQRLKEEGFEAPPDHALLLKPDSSLSPGTKCAVEIKEGFPSTEGPLGMKAGSLVAFSVFDVFRFEGDEIGRPHVPGTPLQFNFSNDVAYNEFARKVKFEPEVKIPDYYQEWDHGADQIWFSAHLEPETKYSVVISPDLTDVHGNKLGREVKIDFITAAYPPSISMTTGHGILEAYVEAKIPLFVLNVDRILVQAGRVSPDAVVPLLSSEKLFWSSEPYQGGTGIFRMEKTLSLKPARNKRQAVPLDLAEVLPDRYGLVLLQLDTGLPDKWERYPKTFVQVTELGISAKFSPDNNLIWVTELKTGNPVADAEIEVRDDLNDVKWRGKTNQQGSAESPGWKILGIKSKKNWNSKPRQWVFARRGKDVAFTSSEWGTGIYPYRFGISYDWNPQSETVQGYIFTERGIYRAGEDVQIKGIVRRREKGGLVLPGKKNIAVEIQDPFSKSVYKNTAPVDEFGSFSLDFKSSEKAALGYYRIIASVPSREESEKETTLYGNFRIEAFRSAEFEVLLRTPASNYIFGQKYEADIRAIYLFGGAMSGQKAAWHLRLNRTWFRPPGFKDYRFGNEIDWDVDEERQDSRLLSSGERILDAEGRLRLSVPLIPEKEKDSVMATLEATVTSPGRRQISNRIQTLVHRGAYAIGLKPRSTLLKKNEKMDVGVVAVDPGGNFVANRKIQIKLIRREWRSVRKSGAGGRFGWMTEKEDTEIASVRVATKSGPSTATFQLAKSGFYVISAGSEDSAGNKISSSTSFYVFGEDYVPWERRDDDTIELIPDRENYQPGDTAVILVKSPYEEAQALITLEREFILESRVVNLKGTASRIEIPIRSEHLPNVFVSLILVQGRTAKDKAAERDDPGKPSFKIGYVNLPVDPSEKRLSVEIAEDKQEYRPRGQVTLTFKVTDKSKSGVRSSLAVAVVDVGVLNLIGYQTPNPFDMFYGEKSLSVETSETRLHIVGQREYGEKGEETGGGGSRLAAAPPGFSEVELRGDFKSTAYWNPALTTEADGTARVSFTLPDNLTTFRVMAVAQTADSRFGQNESTFRVSKALLLQPSTPRFGRVGDRFEAGVIVNNQSGRKGTVAVRIDFEGLKLLDATPDRSIALNSGESREILYGFEVERPGRARLAFRAKMDEETDGLEVTIPLKLPRPLETVALSGDTDSQAEEKIAPPADFYPEQSRLEVTAAATALSGLKGCVDYLHDYPYACLEQKVSSFLPYLLAADVIDKFGVSRFERKDYQDLVRKKIQEVWEYQRDEGSFGLWPDSAFDSPYVSCYAVFALLKARAAGYAVDAVRLENAFQYLKGLLRVDPKSRTGSPGYYASASVWKTIQAFALYDLALAGKADPSYAEKLFAERIGLSLFGQTLLLKALYLGRGGLSSQIQIQEELLNGVKVTSTQAHFEENSDPAADWIYHSSTRTTAFILQTLIEIGSDHPLLPAVARWLVEDGKTGHWRSTQENLYVFYALNEYYKKYEKGSQDLGVAISLAGKSILEESFRINPLRTARAETPLTAFAEKQILPLVVRKSGEGRIYYGARMTYAPSQSGAPRDEGLAVYKKIFSIEGKPLSEVRAGDVVVVTLEIAVPQESLFVVVDDPLPAGFEAANPSFATESEEQQRRIEEQEAEKTRFSWWREFNHVEMRDDRVLLFADRLAAGLHVHRYLARALTPGTFVAPGTKAEQMYAPEVFGRSPEMRLKISK